MNILTIYTQENKYSNGGFYIDSLSKYSQLYTDTRLDIDDNRVDEYEIVEENTLSKLYLYNIYIPLIYRDDLDSVISYLGINKSDLEIKDINLLTTKPKENNTTKKKRWWNIF